MHLIWCRSSEPARSSGRSTSFLELVDALGRLNLDVLVGGEQVVQSLCLAGREQVSAGVQGPPRAVERIVLAAAVPVGVLLR